MRNFQSRARITELDTYVPEKRLTEVDSEKTHAGLIVKRGAENV